jgi:uncharacterized protein with FMN-binding domain
LAAFFIFVYFKNLNTPSPIGKEISKSIPIAVRGKEAIYKDGSYAGSVEDAIYGNYQIRAVVTGGRISDIIPLLYPNDNHTSIAINQQAFGILRMEALQAQSAKVDIVTGASDSAPAFKRSLETALKEAKI